MWVLIELLTLILALKKKRRVFKVSEAISCFGFSWKILFTIISDKLSPDSWQVVEFHKLVNKILAST